MTTHILTLICADRPGLIHDVTAGILDIDGNIVENAQFADPATALFCMRTVIDTDVTNADAVATAVRHRLGDTDIHRLHVRPADERPRTMIMVSRADHCLVDLLYRWRHDLLAVDIPVVVSNHADLGDLVRSHGIEFVHIPVTADTKADAEAQLLDLVRDHRIDLVVLARYMQILSDNLCTALAGRAVNIHHSFLPGFKGAKPYHQAHERGVKLVGATAHFVTADLDEGPIIEQDVARVHHAMTANDLVALGQDTERLVLARAVRYLAEDRVLLIGDRTVVFN